MKNKMVVTRIRRIFLVVCFASDSVFYASQ